MVRLVMILSIVLALIGNTLAQTSSEEWNARDLAKVYLAVDFLDRCRAASVGDVTGDEMDFHSITIRVIEREALKLDPALKLHRLMTPAQTDSVASKPWLCATARLYIFSSLWNRVAAYDYSNDGTTRVPRLKRLNETLQNAHCKMDDPCVLPLMATLERQGFVLRGPYCRAHRQECDLLQKARDANIPLENCDFAVDEVKCEKAIGDQQERFRKAREQK